MKNNVIKFKNTSGFTIVEMIVSTAIIAALAAVFLANYHSYGVKGDLNMAAQKLASDIRMAQGFALGLKESATSTPGGGWGIFLSDRTNQNENKRYTIFANNNCNNAYDGESERFGSDIYFLKENIKVFNNGFRRYNGSIWVNWNTQRVVIIFDPPNPNIRICQAETTNCESAVRVIIHNSAGDRKAVEINNLGLVDVVNL